MRFGNARQWGNAIRDVLISYYIKIQMRYMRLIILLHLFENKCNKGLYEIIIVMAECIVMSHEMKPSALSQRVVFDAIVM